MSLNLKQYNQFLEQVAADLDISPSKYQQAVERYKSVGKWLEDGDYPDLSGELKIYVQGSFRLGTVVRPLIEGKDADYDIDLVCELPTSKPETTPETIKSLIGDRLKENATYTRLLDKEGRRCWTLNYAEQDNIGFHLDVLPAIPDENYRSDTNIAITHKGDNDYSWSSSNPYGYAFWFEERNKQAFLLAETRQKRAIFSRSTVLYASVDEVPSQLIRTPLQQAIQLMKRHRDQRFNGHALDDKRPISMIITTLAAYLYQNEGNVAAALQGIVEKLHAHNSLLYNRILADQSLASMNIIQKRSDGTWYIGNPVNPDENFADRWHEDNDARAKSFFMWVEWLKEDLVDILTSQNAQASRKSLSSSFGDNITGKNFHLLAVQVAPAIITPRQVSIDSAPKPWKNQ